MKRMQVQTPIALELHRIAVADGAPALFQLFRFAADGVDDLTQPGEQEHLLDDFQDQWPSETLADAVVRVIRSVRTTENVVAVRIGAKCEHEVGSLGYGRLVAIVLDFEFCALAGKRTGQEWCRRVVHDRGFDQFFQTLLILAPRRLPRLVD
jgi:hypothetical protein